MKVLIIQTAFIGDAILATAAIETLAKNKKISDLHLLVRKGNESIFTNNPNVSKCLIWDKQKGKTLGLLKLLFAIRNENYDVVFTLQRFFSAGLLCALSKAKNKYGFQKNPLSFLFSKSAPHVISPNGKQHEIERNLALLKTHFPEAELSYPKLHLDKITLPDYIDLSEKYICLAPASVWFTKQLPEEKWTALINACSPNFKIYFLGGASDEGLCDRIGKSIAGKRKYVNLCGKLNLLQSAELMQKAVMNYVNDSAPLHLCSAVNANVTAFFCSTVPAFGFGPLSNNAIIAEVSKNLKCRPCGLHGKKTCPLKHFDCGKIDVITYAI